MNTRTRLAAGTPEGGRTLDDLQFGRVITTAEYRRRGREVITADKAGNVDRLYEIAEEVGRTYTVPLMAPRREAWQLVTGEFILCSRYRAWICAGYDRSASQQNLTQPATHMPVFPLGTWRIDDEDWNNYGYAVYELRWLHPDQLTPTETAWKYQRRHYVTRYVEWRRAGLVPPPIEVVETARGGLSIVNGHRRWAAARELDVLVPAWVSPTVEVETLGKVGLTRELSIIEALDADEDVPQANVDFLRSRIEKKPALEKIVEGGPVYDVNGDKAA